jgi:hypothetical protein
MSPSFAVLSPTILEDEVGEENRFVFHETAQNPCTMGLRAGQGCLPARVID